MRGFFQIYLLLSLGPKNLGKRFFNYWTKFGKLITQYQENSGLWLPNQLYLALYMYFEMVFYKDSFSLRAQWPVFFVPIFAFGHPSYLPHITKSPL